MIILDSDTLQGPLKKAACRLRLNCCRGRRFPEENTSQNANAEG